MFSSSELLRYLAEDDTDMIKKKIKVLGIIPARWGSTRFPGKSLAPLCGRPLIQWVIERAQMAKALDKLWSPPMTGA